MRFLFWFFLLSGSVLGELTWTPRMMEIAATPKDEFVEGVFRFKNTGSYPVTILKTESGCGCTTAKIENRVYAPGESGEMVERYHIGLSRGLHQTGITVVTDDPKSPKTVLAMRIMIEKSAEITPEVLWWKLGATPSPQEATIKIVRSTPLHLISAESSSPGWSVKLITVTPGWQYLVRITPSDLSRADSAIFLIKPAVSPSDPAALRIRARVK